MAARIAPTMDAASPGRLQTALLEEAVRRVVGVLHPERVYLYGSRARGDAGPDSDYDLMVVVAEETTRPHRLEQAALRALADVDLPVSVLVLDRRGFERQCGGGASLPATVEREGRLLYPARGFREGYTETRRRIDSPLDAPARGPRHRGRDGRLRDRRGAFREVTRVARGPRPGRARFGRPRRDGAGRPGLDRGRRDRRRPSGRGGCPGGGEAAARPRAHVSVESPRATSRAREGYQSSRTRR